MQRFVRLSVLPCLAVSGMLLSGPVQAAAVYKWVDEEGVTWFSEKPPAGESAGNEVSRVPVEDFSSREIRPEGDLQSVLDVAASIEASRLERERTRRENERLMLERRQLQQQSDYTQQPYSERYNVWYAPPYYRPGKPRPPYARPPGYRPPGGRPPGHRPPEPAPLPGGTPPGRVTFGR